jgi:pimeloyl-ACP methyl ester carboxylesterase
VAYEPVLFNLLFHGEPDSPSVREICAVQEDVRRLVAVGKPAEAGRRFVDYWSGEGVWNKLPDWQREAVAKRMTKVVSDFDATMDNPTTLEEYRSLDIPTLFMYGAQSPESTRRIAEWLGAALPRAEVRGLLPLGHMGPVTHAEQVQRIIEGFIRKQPQGILTHQLRRSRN